MRRPRRGAAGRGAAGAARRAARDLLAAPAEEAGSASLARLVAASLVSGAVVGALGAAFRASLAEAERLREAMIAWSSTHPGLGWLAPMLAVAACAATARFLVMRFAPTAAGSGVQHVEAMMRGEAKPSPPEVVPVKFLGGVLALGSGLALGREGPTVQMGATVARITGRAALRGETDRALVDAGGAGAGLAAAFNAPIGGAVFVCEELAGRFSPRLLLAALASIAAAVAVMRWLLGDSIDLPAAQDGPPAAWIMPFFLALGILLGLFGKLYNLATVGLLRLTDGAAPRGSLLRAAAIGAGVGLLVWFAPAMVGGGERLAGAILRDALPLRELLLICLVRCVIGPLCYAAGTPGGLFAPLLLLGAATGASFAGALNLAVPGLGLPMVAFAVVGMAGLFTGCVQAPLTAIVLGVEMTGRHDLALAMLVGAFGAMLAARWVRSPPIYESLRQRMRAAR